MADIVVIHGPNLNLLGDREQAMYGKTNLDDINSYLVEKAEKAELTIKCYQSNYEGEIIDIIQNEGRYAGCIIINAGGFTHTSVAIRDAILARQVPAIEVHMSNIYKREEFRHVSYLKDIVVGQIVGFGAMSYYLAIEAAINIVKLGGSR